jgi:hypothetical protein
LFAELNDTDLHLHRKLWTLSQIRLKWDMVCGSYLQNYILECSVSRNYGNITKCFHHEDTSNLTYWVALFQIIPILTYVHMDARAHDTRTHTELYTHIYMTFKITTFNFWSTINWDTVIFTASKTYFRRCQKSNFWSGL